MESLKCKNWDKMPVTVAMFGRWELAVTGNVYIRNEQNHYWCANFQDAQTINTYFYIYVWGILCWVCSVRLIEIYKISNHSHWYTAALIWVQIVSILEFLKTLFLGYFPYTMKSLLLYCLFLSILTKKFLPSHKV